MKRSILLAAMLAFSVSAHAEGFSYDYIMLGYSKIDIDDVNDDGDALGIGGSYGITKNFHVFAGFEDGELDSSTDVSSTSIGVGLNTALSGKVDGYARLSHERIDVSGFFSEDDSGYGLGAGLRIAANEAIELNVGIKYVDFGDFDDTSYSIGALYNFAADWAAGLSVDFNDDASVYLFQGRYYFGR